MSSIEESTARGSSATFPTTYEDLPLPANESDLLEREAMLARAGVSLCLEDLRADARELLDLEGWVREKPWWTLGAGAGAGFVAGKFAFPGKDDEEGDGGGRRPRDKSRSSTLGSLIGPLAVPIVGAAVAPLLKGITGGGDDRGGPSSLERLAFGRLLSLFNRYV